MHNRLVRISNTIRILQAQLRTMKNKVVILILSFVSTALWSQELLTPEKMWSLGRVGFQALSNDGSTIYISVGRANMQENKTKTSFYAIQVNNGLSEMVSAVPSTKPKPSDDLENASISNDQKYILYTKEVHIEDVIGSDKYPDLTKANVLVYDQLNQRHWDTWEDGNYSHVFLAKNNQGQPAQPIDIMAGLKFDCPQKPHGGAEDLLFTPDSKQILFVTKMKSGTAYATSTNTDIYCYDIETQQTQNLTEGMNGYDTQPSFSNDGHWLAWTSMARDGFEADKNDLWLMNWKDKTKINLTADWDETVGGFRFSNDDKKIYFVAAIKGTEQLFEIDITSETPSVKQITSGQFDINGLCAQDGNTLYVSRTDMNHAAEIFAVNLLDGSMKQVSHVNDNDYASIKMCKVEGRYTSVGSDQLFSWVIYPPDFDPNKKYPTLLYCQGGPQSALSQFYSFRWNFQLMASNGYIVIAPNRTGMPGWGTAWNENISKDWGGNPMRDYLAAIDDLANEPYVDRDRMGAVGASYGGYSVLMLAGIHENRFKTFISHCGLFDLKSWYGTTEELWFANWDIGGAYWDKDNREAKNSYREFSPSNYVQQWNTPIMIIQGGKDFRVPIEQGLQAYQAAQLQGIKSRFMLFPEENHWVLKPQNGLIWQREFYKWLKETL